MDPREGHVPPVGAHHRAAIVVAGRGQGVHHRPVRGPQRDQRSPRHPRHQGLHHDVGQGGIAGDGHAQAGGPLRPEGDLSVGPILDGAVPRHAEQAQPVRPWRQRVEPDRRLRAGHQGVEVVDGEGVAGRVQRRPMADHLDLGDGQAAAARAGAGADGAGGIAPASDQQGREQERAGAGEARGRVHGGCPGWREGHPDGTPWPLARQAWCPAIGPAGRRRPRSRRTSGW